MRANRLFFKTFRSCLYLLMLLVVWSAQAAAIDEPKSYDVVIYGGTACGIAAAVQARRMNKSVVVLEPMKRIGGLTTGGLGQTDIGNKAAIGGISREFYKAVKKFYSDDRNWTWQKREDYSSIGQSRTRKGEDAMWTFEPSAALKIFNQWVRENRIELVYDQKLDRAPRNNQQPNISRGVKVSNQRIVEIIMQSGEIYRGKMFIDATYEGDLMAAAGVSYTVGRESNDLYDETLNGVQVKNATHHQFQPKVDPYIEKGNPNSGLLPGIDPDGPGDEGEGDHRIQAYNFRMCLTNHPENRIPFHKPSGYESRDHELLLRNLEAGDSRLPWSNGWMPNHKTDTNNNRGVSTDFIGQNYEYADATYTKRAEIVQRHRVYQQGLMWTLANHPRVPENIRNEFSRWGTCKDEFDRSDGWPNQIYVREARRMVGAYVMTQHHCQGRKIAQDAIGLAAYTMDSHNTQRYVDGDGFVRNEGDVQVGGFSPYGISYRSITPKTNECRNLLVPVALSASHIAYGSIRMEPVFMVLGQSAATAASLCIDNRCDVQKIDYAKLRRQLLNDGQRLEWESKPQPAK